MGNHFEAIVKQLEADWPGWKVWYVPRALGGMIWCARRRDDERHVLNADSSEELIAMIGREES
jgi:hypothetical protein